MVGLLVTPTTCWSSRSLARPPVMRRPREMSSSHTATPAADSSASRSVMSSAPRNTLPDKRYASLPVVSAARGGTGDDAGLGERRVRRGDHPVRREAELLEQHLVRRGRPVVFNAHAL